MTQATPTLVVTFRNTADVMACLAALRGLDPAHPAEVFICENGGPDSFAALLSAVAAVAVPSGPGPLTVQSPRFDRTVCLEMPADGDTPPLRLHLGCAVENLGYAGGVNAWLAPLLTVPGWSGAWVLNPDTEPDRSALVQLMQHAGTFGRGMVGSRLQSPRTPDIVHCRGLAWSRLRASTISVDLHSPALPCPAPEQLDTRLDAPSGASIYVTRQCLDRIGLMDERYFLYFEDLDWGLRAKQQCGVGYAHGSVVRHAGGTTIGTSTSRHGQSRLAVYLDFRNRLLFVRNHFRRWLAWTFVMEVADLALYLRTGKVGNMIAAVQGMRAGLAGQTGRPDPILAAHVANSKSG